MSIPMIWAAACSASAGVLASLIPPAFPRPPTGTCAFTATGPISRAAAAASAGVLATFPGGMAMPKDARTSFAWYSSSFMPADVNATECAGRGDSLGGALGFLGQAVRDLVEVVRDLIAHHRVEQPPHRAHHLHGLLDPGLFAG